MSDTRIPYGARCTWWDSIDKVGLIPSRDGLGGGIPCCPVCGNVLFEVESEAVWWAGAHKYEADGHPGYVAMLTWARGRCFPNAGAMATAYLEHVMGSRAIQHVDTQEPPTKRQRRRRRGL